MTAFRTNLNHNTEGHSKVKRILTTLMVVLAGIVGVQLAGILPASATASIEASAECDTLTGEWGVTGLVSSGHPSDGDLTWHTNFAVDWQNQPTVLPANGSVAFDLRVKNPQPVLNIQVKVDWPERGAQTTKNVQVKFEGDCEQTKDAVLPDVSHENAGCPGEGGQYESLGGIVASGGEGVSFDLRDADWFTVTPWNNLLPGDYFVVAYLEPGYQWDDLTGGWEVNQDGNAFLRVTITQPLNKDCEPEPTPTPTPTVTPTPTPTPTVTPTPQPSPTPTPTPTHTPKPTPTPHVTPTPTPGPDCSDKYNLPPGCLAYTGGNPAQHDMALRIGGAAIVLLFVGAAAVLFPRFAFRSK